jgi:cysteine-S-conjugate beta-lyase
VVLTGGGQKACHAFLDALRLFGLGYSWGGYESLAVPVSLSDRTVANGRYEGPLVRLQIGLEDIEDLKADLSNALEAARQA